MARIEGVHLPDRKRVEYALTYIFGVGLKRSRDILTKVKIDFNKRAKDLTDEDVAAIQKAIDGMFVIEGELHKEITMGIKRLQEIGSYRGLRHKRGLPVRGQNTKTNARTRKGPRRSGAAVALKRKAAAKK
ncbi:30S ribosomal protein S13 [bacterium]|jgi:small subunit ribosomal protein S13|nr:30S ribosomal protein S13 [bacterium]